MKANSTQCTTGLTRAKASAANGNEQHREHVHREQVRERQRDEEQPCRADEGHRDPCPGPTHLVPPVSAESLVNATGIILTMRNGRSAFVLLSALGTLVVGATWAGAQTLRPVAESEIATQRKWVAKHAPSAWAGQPRLSLTTVDVAVLANAGLHLKEPTRSSALTQEAARAAAESAVGSGRTLEVRLADCYWETVRPPIDQTCWVVSKSPVGFTSHGPPGSARMTATYLVVLIDAETGAFLKAISGS